MLAGIKFIPLVFIGIAAIAWGMQASHRLAKPYNIAAAMLVLAGLLITLAGILLTIIPDFFR